MPLKYFGYTFGRRVRATGGDHEHEVSEALICNAAQARGGAEASARREPEYAEPGNWPAGCPRTQPVLSHHDTLGIKYLEDTIEPNPNGHYLLAQMGRHAVPDAA